MNSFKMLITPRPKEIPYNILASAIANLDFDEKILWSFINEIDDEIMMESVVSIENSKTMLISNACGGGYESSREIDGLGDNVGIESALKDGYGLYNIKEIYG